MTQLFLLHVSPSHNSHAANWTRANSLEHLFASVRRGLTDSAEKHNRKVCFSGRGNRRVAIFTTPRGREVERRTFEVIDQFAVRED